MSLYALLCLLFLAITPGTPAWANSSAYGTYGLYATGSTRVLGMGGAFVGVADDATSVVSNPAGLALARWTFDLQGTSNRIVNREGDIDLDGSNDGYPYNFLYTAGALSYGRLGLGVGYSVPYDVEEDFGGVSTSTQTLKIESIDIALSFRVMDSLSLGITLHRETATLGYNDSAFAEQEEDSQEIIYPTLGIIYRPNKKLSFGIAYSPERRYDMDETKNDNLLTAYRWFQDLVIPAKLTLGLSLRLKKNLNLVGDMDIFQPAENAYLVGSDGFNSDHRYIEKQYTLWHGGFELFVIDKKNIEFIWRGGGYQEPSRLIGGEDRFHFTMGVEVRFGVIKFSSAYDQAKDFTSYAQSIGISIDN